MMMMAMYFSLHFAELAICVLAITCPVLDASGSRTGPESRECNIVDRFKSPYVTGFVSAAVTSYGCSSRQVASDGRQVHIIYLHGTQTAEHVKPTPSVTLLIKPSASFDVTSFNGVIFVLSSDSPIIWKLQTEWFKNVTVEVWVSFGSEITSDRRLKVNINRLPVTGSSRSGMVTWAQNKWGAVSTLTAPATMANIITAVIGTDASASAFCDAANLSNATSFSANNVKRQNSAGCVSSNDIVNNRVVHVIELISVPNGTVDVAVNIFARSKVTNVKQLVLVLKTHQRVRWHISTHRLRCTLDIITDQFVNGSGINVEPFRVVAERLDVYAGHSLITWTSEKYGQPLSYTRMNVANQFDVIVDSTAAAEERPKVRSLKETISSSLTIQCTSDDTQVALLKASIESTGLSRSNFTLSDNACHASENSTHILLTTRNSECGTIQQNSDGDSDSIVYQNMIMVHGGMEDMPISVNFCCVYPVKQVNQHSHGSPTRARLKLYRDEHFVQEITETPAVVKDVNELFVEIDAAINVMFGECSIEPGSRTSRQHKNLINGCWSDRSVTWMHSKSHGISDIVNHGGIRFRLDFSSYRSEGVQNLVTLQCRLVVCTIQAAVRSLSSGHRLCDCKEQLADASEVTVAVSAPILIQPVTKLNETQKAYLQSSNEEQKYCNEVTVGINSAVVVGIAFAAFMIGVLLMASLWCIHERTGKLVERKRKMLRSADTSGESTPSSTVARHVSTR